MNASHAARATSSLLTLALLLIPTLPSVADAPKIDPGKTLALMEKAADWQLSPSSPWTASK